MKRIMELIGNKKCAYLVALLCLLSYSNIVSSQTYTLNVGGDVDISQTAYNGGYIDNVGLAAFIDPHLSFSKNYDGSARITVKSYFDYTATVKLVFIERYQSYYSGRNHTRAATYYKDVNIRCNYVAPQPNIKPTKVLLPERVRVPLNKREDIYPIYEPYGAKGTEFNWNQSQGTAVFSHGQYDNGGYHVTGRSPGLGRVSVKVDNDNNLYASTIIEVVDLNNLPPDNIFLPSSIEISIGGHTTLEPILVPEGTSTSYTWTSDNSNVCTVNYGKVTGVRAGTTTVTVKTANNLQTTCTVNVVSSNGKDDEDDNGAQITGSIDGHDFIDLGLSVKWATCNVGASKPEDFGDYFAWGETTEKSSYSWNNYKYGSNALNCRNIGNDISGTSYDAAYVNWSSNWRMPNEKEMGELISKCIITNTTQSGVEGFLVTGPNGNSIFLPTANSKFTTSYSGCRYWTSTVDDYNGRSLFINYSNGKVSPTLQSQTRPMGLPIRAITSASTSTPQAKLALSANPSGGSVESGTKVYLTAKADGSTVSGADIYYTTNGTSPSKSSNKYTSSGISISQACKLKAIAYKDGYETSEVESWSYTIKSSTVEPTSISVSPSTKTIEVGKTFTPTYSLTPSNATTTVTWSSDDSSIASVDSKTGLVTGQKAGSTYINATTANGKSNRCKVTVEDDGPIYVTSISLNEKSWTLPIYGSKVLSATVYPSNATNKSVTWSSSNEEVASVSNGRITAITEGYAEITCKANDGSGVSASCHVFVNNGKIDDIIWGIGEGMYIGKTGTVKMNQKIEIAAVDMEYAYIPNCTYYYTLDGSTPTKNSSHFTGSTNSTIIINKSCTLKAFATCDGYKDSEVISWQFTVESDDVVINTVNFPDENFRNWILEQSYGKDGILTAAELASVKSINIEEKKIENLKGLDLFDGLEILFCRNNKLLTLDLSCNYELKRLYCSNNQLTSIDVSRNYKLQNLSCHNNKLTVLDVSNNKALITLSCYNNEIKNEGMDILINSLSAEVPIKDFELIGPLNKEKNICTTEQVAIAKSKGWTPLYWNGTKWLEYEGGAESEQSITLPVSVTLNIGETFMLFSLTDANTGLAWSSSDASIARFVSPGTVMGLKAGTAIIRVKMSNGLTAECFVNVVAPTGINDVREDYESQVPIYNLRGQRLVVPQKGVNIIGGKKIIVK